MKEYKQKIEAMIDSTIPKNIENSWFFTSDLKKELEDEFLNPRSYFYRAVKNSYEKELMYQLIENFISITIVDRVKARKEQLPAFIHQLKGVYNSKNGLIWPDKYMYNIKFLDKVNLILPCVNPYQIRESDGIYKLYMTNGNGACTTLKEIFAMYSDTPTEEEVYSLTGIKNIILNRTKNTNVYRYSAFSKSVSDLDNFAKYLLKSSPFKGTTVTKKQYERLTAMLEHATTDKIDTVKDLLLGYLKLVTVKD